MEQEISQDLKDKLKIIERETEFFSRKPQRITYGKFMKLAAIFFILLTVYFGITEEDKTMFFTYLLFMGFHIMIYLHQKQLFEMYSNACEIIKYYKEKSEKKI